MPIDNTDWSSLWLNCIFWVFFYVVLVHHLPSKNSCNPLTTPELHTRVNQLLSRSICHAENINYVNKGKAYTHIRDGEFLWTCCKSADLEGARFSFSRQTFQIVKAEYCTSVYMYFEIALLKDTNIEIIKIRASLSVGLSISRYCTLRRNSKFGPQIVLFMTGGSSSGHGCCRFCPFAMCWTLMF